MILHDLFCGCGGFAQGFHQVSPAFSIALGVDLDYIALDSYHMDFRQPRLYNVISKIDFLFTEGCAIHPLKKMQNPFLFIGSVSFLMDDVFSKKLKQNNYRY